MTVENVPVPVPAVPVSLNKASAGTPVPAQAAGTVLPTHAPRTRTRRVVRGLRGVLGHEYTRALARTSARHALYVVGGGRVLTRRAWDSRTTARHERFARAAEAAGNTELAADWTDRAHQFRAARHARRMDLLAAPQRLAKGAAVTTGSAAGALLGLGALLAVADGDPGMILAPAAAAIDAVRLLVAAVALVWDLGVVLAPWLLLAALWVVGARSQAAPAWALPRTLRDDGAPITPSIVVTAVRDLGIATLRKAVTAMGDAGAAMLSPIVTAGCGIEVEVSLPSGVSTEEVMSRRRKLAENLGRHEHEVHVTKAQAARTVHIWAADSGALDEPVPASPLVTDPGLTADYKNGRAPWGPDLRGDLASVSLYQRHVLITGLSNQGKTASLRALALWLALDRTVEFRIGDLKGIGDWRMFTGLATVLIEGPTDDHVADVTVMAEDAVDEMNRRLLAPAGTSFPPLVIIVDEAQVAYGSAAVGEDKRPYGGAKATSRYFQAVKKIHDQGRAVNVTIWEGTQDPTNENLPKRSREGNHIRAALVLGTEAQAKMALGETPVDKGAAPHKLRQGFDKGQLVAVGEGIPLPAGQSFMNIRTHFVDDDEAKEIAERAKEMRNAVPASTPEESAERDTLADVAQVLGSDERVRTQEVLHRLIELADFYREWSFADLTAALAPFGAGPYKSNGNQTIARTRVLEALAERENDAG
ncbi:ATP-binding protein [Streptomyces olivaceus]|uniref:ATP-binding protein n=1 Tax=Streptomyces olivaceus TaxID=47716 RepID=UPI0035592404